jgi:hypothetical protein
MISICKSCIDDLLARFAIDMAFDSWIVLENVVGFLASWATCYNFGGQFQGHIHQGRTSEQKLSRNQLHGHFLLSFLSLVLGDSSRRNCNFSSFAVDCKDSWEGMLHYPSTKTEREMKHVLPCIQNKNTCHFIK